MTLPGLVAAKNLEDVTDKEIAWDNLGSNVYAELPIASPSLDLKFAENKTLVDSVSNSNLITFSRASIGTYIDSNGAIQDAAIDQARFTHSPATGESLGLLIEESRTNYLLASNDFTNATYWFPEATTVTLAGSSNRGNYYKLSGTNATPYTGLVSYFLTYSVAVPLSSTATVSLDAKVPDGESGSRDLRFTFISTSGSVGSVTDGIFATVSNSSTDGIDLGNGWRRYSATFTWMSSAAGSVFVKVNPLFSSSLGVLIANIQLEVGNSPSSYIATTTTAVTRAADVASITGTNFTSWYNQNEGTTFVEGAFFETSQRRTLIGPLSPNLSPTQTRYIGAESNLFQLSADGPNEAVSSPIVSSVFFKGAVAFRTEAIFAVASGQTVSASRWTNFMLSGVTGWNMFQRGDGGAGRFNGIISRLSHWPVLLQSPTLQYLTSASGSPSATSHPYFFTVLGKDILALTNAQETSPKDFVLIRNLTSPVQPRLTTAAQNTASGVTVRDVAMLKASPTTNGNYLFSSGLALSGLSMRVNGTPVLSIATTPFSGSTATSRILLRELQPQANWRITESMASGVIASPEIAVPYETDNFVFFMKAGQN